jgi:hypothetical protein
VNEDENDTATDTASGLAGGYLRVMEVSLTHTVVRLDVGQALLNLRAKLYSFMEFCQAGIIFQGKGG